MGHFRSTRLAVAVAAALWLGAAPLALAASPAPAEGENGMVVTAQHLATDVGLAVLEAGGNAVDAAVAVGYALAVTYPTAGNLGGGGFMTIRLADGTTTFLDFRERAPGAATKDMYLDDKGEPVPGASTDTWLATGVPGSVAGFETAREKYGTKSRAELIAPALELARDGFVLEQGDVASFARRQRHAGAGPGGGEDLPEGRPAAAARRDAGAGRPRRDAAGDLGGRRGRLLQGRDRRPHRQGERGERRASSRRRTSRPTRCASSSRSKCDYRGYDIVSSPPPSSGGLIICEILNILEGYPISYLGYGSAETTRLMVEAMRHAYVDRNTALGDPDFVENPVDEADERRLRRGDPGADRPLPGRRLGRPDAGRASARARRRRTIRSSTRTATPSP